MNNKDINQQLSEVIQQGFKDSSNQYSFLDQSFISLNQFCDLISNGAFKINSESGFSLEKAKEILYNIMTCGNSYHYELKGYSNEKGVVTLTSGSEIQHIVNLLKDESLIGTVFSPLTRRRLLQYQIKLTYVSSYKRTEEEIINIAQKLGIIK